MPHPDSPNALVACRNLSKVFREGDNQREVLAGIDLEVEAGEMVAILGRSGCGKSTLLNLIGGLDQPSAGEVWVAGQSIGALDEARRTLYRRHQVGFVFQFFNLIPTLTAEENLWLPLELRGTARSEQRHRAAGLLERVGLGDRAGTFPDRLSGGERQRLAVARGLIHDPILVLADEPTGNLDPETGTHILDLMVELTRQRGKTLLVATHSDAVAQRSDRILQFRDGELLARGAP
ncbi:MAG: ABC transporter ATP-binding protein [Acidobacteriota bacterium]